MADTQTIHTQHTQRKGDYPCRDCNGTGCHWCSGSGEEPSAEELIDAGCAEILELFPDWDGRLERACDVATCDLEDTQGYYTKRHADDPGHITVMFVEWGKGIEVAAEVHLSTLPGPMAFLMERHDPLADELARAGFALCDVEVH